MEISIVRILTLLGAGLACLTLVAWAQESSTTVEPVVRASSAGPVTIKKVDTCAGAQRAITFYRQKYRSHREAMWEDGPVPRVWYRDCAVVRRRAVEWRDRAAAAGEALAKWVEYHHAWRDWLPAGWRNVGSCETGYGGDPNWGHYNSNYQGAFGFATSSWDGFVSSADPKAGPYPADAHVATPRQQYEVALAIHRRYGLSGWGCRGAFYSWG